MEVRILLNGCFGQMKKIVRSLLKFNRWAGWQIPAQAWQAWFIITGLFLLVGWHLQFLMLMILSIFPGMLCFLKGMITFFDWCDKIKEWADND